MGFCPSVKSGPKSEGYQIQPGNAVIKNESVFQLLSQRGVNKRTDSLHFDIEDFNHGSTTRRTVRENQSSRRCCKEAQRAKGRKVFGKVIIQREKVIASYSHFFRTCPS